MWCCVIRQIVLDILDPLILWRLELLDHDHDTVPHLKRLETSATPLWEPQSMHLQICLECVYHHCIFATLLWELIVCLFKMYGSIKLQCVCHCELILFGQVAVGHGFLGIWMWTWMKFITIWSHSQAYSTLQVVSVHFYFLHQVEVLHQECQWSEYMSVRNYCFPSFNTAFSAAIVMQ
jgi:hypothetical protein